MSTRYHEIPAERDLATLDHAALPDLLPLYVNCSLAPGEREQVEVWLASDPAAQVELAFYQQLQHSLFNRPVQPAPPDLARQIAANQSGSQRSWWQPFASQPRPVLLHQWTQWGAALSFSFLALLFLWLLVQPGLALEWTVVGDQPHTYRIYRAPIGGGTATLVAEVTAQSGATAYRYVDSRLLPGQEYRYWVEAVNGAQVQSASVVGRSRDLLPYQLALLLASLVVGYSLTLWLQFVVAWLAQKPLKIVSG